MLVLIDADFMLFLCTHNKKESEEKTFEQVKESANVLIKKIISKTDATHYLGFFTSSVNFRKGLYPEYKANRIGRELPPFFKELREYLKDTYGFAEEPGYEADDLVSIYSHLEGVHNTIIVSTDKDVLNLAGMAYNPVKDVFISTTKEEADRFFWTSMISGDSIDNIKGLPGKGPSYASKMFSARSTEELHHIVLDCYILQYGEYEGIAEFFRNYRMLKILTDPHPGWYIALLKPIPVPTSSNESNTDEILEDNQTLPKTFGQDIDF